MTPSEFEDVLQRTSARLASDAQNGSKRARNSKEFEVLVLEALREEVTALPTNAEPSFHQHAFPDIVVNGFGVEVKFTIKDSWSATGNSIFETMRDPSAHLVYVVFGKMGGWPEVRWSKYDDCITHVRISHAPRFVVDMESPSRLFETIGIDYSNFAVLSANDKMTHVRQYARGRLNPGERLWWLEDQGEDDHTWPAEVRVYMQLSREEKDKLRAEAALLCPEVVSPPRTKYKYVDAALYLLRRHGVFCPQARDLFSAGSVALRDDPTRGGYYLPRALRSIEVQMKQAAAELADELIVEYWGKSCEPEQRIAEWLLVADELAKDWTPSELLFLEDDD